MIVIPCSITALSAFANEFSTCLITRAGDLILKDGRKLSLTARATLLHSGQIHSMSLAVQSCVVIFTPVHKFFECLECVEALSGHTVVPIVNQMGIGNERFPKRRDSYLGQIGV